MNFYKKIKKSEGCSINVVYKNEVWKTLGLVLRDSLFSLLKLTNPEKIITIKKNSSTKKVKITELTTTTNYRL